MQGQLTNLKVITYPSKSDLCSVAMCVTRRPGAGRFNLQLTNVNHVLHHCSDNRLFISENGNAFWLCDLSCHRHGCCVGCLKNVNHVNQHKKSCSACPKDYSRDSHESSVSRDSCEKANIQNFKIMGSSLRHKNHLACIITSYNYWQC